MHMNVFAPNHTVPKCLTIVIQGYTSTKKYLFGGLLNCATRLDFSYGAAKRPTEPLLEMVVSDQQNSIAWTVIF